MKPTSAVTAAAAAMLLCFGCAGPAPGPDPAPSSRTAGTRADADGVCTFITSAELSRFLGQELTRTNHDLDHSICHYYAADDTDRQRKSSFAVALVSTTDGRQLAAAAGFTDDQTVPGIGDGAWYIHREPASLFILKGNTYLRMSGQGGLESAGRSSNLTADQFRPIAELIATRL